MQRLGGCTPYWVFVEVLLRPPWRGIAFLHSPECGRANGPEDQARMLGVPGSIPQVLHVWM